MPASIDRIGLLTSRTKTWREQKMQTMNKLQRMQFVFWAQYRYRIVRILNDMG